MMSEFAVFLLFIGALMLLGLAADFLGRRTPLPRVTLLLILGIILGDGGLSIIPDTLRMNFDLVTNIALMMVGFLIGGRLNRDAFARSGTQLVAISFSAAITTMCLVMVSMLLIGISIDIAILLGCISAATAPAATVDVVVESKAKGPFTELLMGIVAIDDVWALLLFSLGLAAIAVFGALPDSTSYILAAGQEILGAVLIGFGLGYPAAFLTGRIRPGQPMLLEALGLVMLCGGLALWLEVSFLIAAVTLGSTISNFSKHHEYPFHEIENIELPFMIVFFILAGAQLEFGALADLSVVGVAYIIARTIGKVFGTLIGAHFSGANDRVRHWMGIALLPQAGVAVGMALLAAERFPASEQIILTVVIGTTIVFELFGPVLTRLAIRRGDGTTSK